MDTLLLDTPLKTAEPLVQVQANLKPGVYVVDLVILDVAGQQSSAQVSFQIEGSADRPPLDIRPVITPDVTRLVTPIKPVVPIKRVPIKKPPK
jgi:hypothetical protein